MSDISPSKAAAEFLAGSRSILPLVVAVLPVGLVFGAVAATKGLSPLEAMLMSALVFAGGSQFVAMDIWTHPASWAGAGFAALLVNLRHVLMGVSIVPKMEGFGTARTLAGLFFLADEIWAVAELRARQARLTPLWFAGVVTPFYLTWVLAGLAGAVLGGFIGDAALIGLDFAFPAVFIVLIMGFWKGTETGLVLVASAACALLVHHFVPGVWYIAAGALGGLAAATLAPRSAGELVMSLDWMTLAAILAMAAATVTTRLCGFFLHRFMTLSPNGRRILDAIPPAVLAAVVAPTAFATGVAESLACLITALAALRLPLLASVAIGVATVALFRLAGF